MQRSTKKKDAEAATAQPIDANDLASQIPDVSKALEPVKEEKRVPINLSTITELSRTPGSYSNSWRRSPLMFIDTCRDPRLREEMLYLYDVMEDAMNRGDKVTFDMARGRLDQFREYADCGAQMSYGEERVYGRTIGYGINTRVETMTRREYGARYEMRERREELHEVCNCMKRGCGVGLFVLVPEEVWRTLPDISGGYNGDF